MDIRFIIDGTILVFSSFWMRVVCKHTQADGLIFYILSHILILSRMNPEITLMAGGHFFSNIMKRFVQVETVNYF